MMRVPHVFCANFVFQQGPFGHQHTGRLYASDEFVPGENDRVFVNGRLPDPR